MLEWVRPTYDFALQYAKKLVADIPDEQMAAQPVAGLPVTATLVPGFGTCV